MRGSGIGAIAGVALALAAAAAAAPGRPQLVTRGADGNSYRPSISADGRYVAFESNADSLSDQDNDRFRNVYVRDMRGGRTTLVSRADGAAGAPAKGASLDSSISADGRFVAFVSRARNLGLNFGDEADDPQATGVFVRDLREGTTRPVALGTEPSLSATGRFLAFASRDPTLTGSRTEQIVVRDLVERSDVVVSRTDGPDGAVGNFSSFAPSISADGRRVAFESFAENLDRFGEEGEFHKIFVRDLPTNDTERVSRGSGPDGQPGNGASLDPAISGDGRFVTFWSTSYNFRRGGGLFDPDHAWVRDLAADRITLVDRAGAYGRPGNGSAELPSISHDGRFIVFASGATNLVPGDPSRGEHVFLRDAQSGTTERLTPGSADPRGMPVGRIAAGGRYVVFDSAADHLSSVDDDRFRHVYRVRR